MERKDVGINFASCEQEFNINIVWTMNNSVAECDYKNLKPDPNQIL